MKTFCGYIALGLLQEVDALFILCIICVYLRFETIRVYHIFFVYIVNVSSKYLSLLYYWKSCLEKYPYRLISHLNWANRQKNIEVYMSWSIIQQYIQENIPEKVCSLLLPFPSIWWSRNFFLLHGCLWTFSLVFRLHRIGISAATS